MIKTGQSDIPELTREEGQDLFDRNARRLLGISGQDFLRGWDSGEYADADDPKISSLAVLIPFAR